LASPQARAAAAAAANPLGQSGARETAASFRPPARSHESAGWSDSGSTSGRRWIGDK